LPPSASSRSSPSEPSTPFPLGGSSVANLFPEKRDVSPGYTVKDKLENKLHDLVCDWKMTLRAAQ
jgi:hypothetical protein